MKKDKTNWFYIALGFFFIIGFLVPKRKDVNEHELVTQQIIVSGIQKINYHKSDDKYRIFSPGYENSFVIRTPGRVGGRETELDRITKNDTLVIKIHASRQFDTDAKQKAIPIYSLKKNGKLIYDVDTYNKAQTTYDKRWGIIFLIMGSLFLLRGFTLISSKTAYIIAGLSIITIITISLMGIW